MCTGTKDCLLSIIRKTGAAKISGTWPETAHIISIYLNRYCFMEHSLRFPNLGLSLTQRKTTIKKNLI
jgi:hypothetical protein